MKPIIVSLSHYPISTPLHGGQRRVAAISKLAQQSGFEFHHIPIFSLAGYPNANEVERQTTLPQAVLDELHQPGVREDVNFSRIVGPDHPLVEGVLQRIVDIEPDIIQFEHPWLFGLFSKELRENEKLKTAKLVYSSHNVETNLIGAHWTEEARAIEAEIVQAADLVVTVSKLDADVFDDWRGAGAKPSVVASNGCWAPDLSDDHPPTKILDSDYAIVVGSEHPPNAKGYWDCIGSVPGFLPPESHLVVAGGVNRLLRKDDRFLRFPRMNAEFVRSYESVAEETLSSLLYHAKAICLPITEGGGTNLKTAEALMWLKPVVAMRHAMRGFEESEELSGIYIADAPHQFRKLLRDVMVGKLGSERTADSVAAYGWPSQLAPLMRAYEDLLRSEGGTA